MNHPEPRFDVDSAILSQDGNQTAPGITEAGSILAIYQLPVVYHLPPEPRGCGQGPTNEMEQNDAMHDGGNAASV